MCPSSRPLYSLENDCGAKGDQNLCSQDMPWKIEILSVICPVFLLLCDEIKSHVMK